MKIQKKSSSQLFFKQYRYSVSIQSSGIALVRSKSHNAIDFASKKYNNSIYNDAHYNILRKFAPIKNIDSLHSLIDVLSYHENNIRTAYTDLNTLRIYCNDVSIIEEIKSIPELKLEEIVERIDDLPDNAVVLKRSDFKFRSYLCRPKKYDSTVEDSIRQSLLAQSSSSFKPSPLFEKWLKKKMLDESFIFRTFGTIGGAMHPRPTMIENQMFLDYNDESIITLLNLIKPGIIRKTLDIIVDK